jgi:hypothetical protein
MIALPPPPQAACLTDFLLVIRRAVNENNHTLFNRLQQRVANNGRVPLPPNLAAAAAANARPVSNGYSQPYPRNSGGFQQAQQATGIIYTRLLSSDSDIS